MKGDIGMANYENATRICIAHPYIFVCSTMRGRIKGTDSTINAILATAVLYELRWKIWNGAE